MKKYYNHTDFSVLDDGDLNNGVLINGFKTLQQKTDYTCGPCCILMVLNFYNNFDFTEKQIAQFCKSRKFKGTKLKQMLKFFKKQNYETISSIDFKRDKSGYIFDSYKKFKSFVIKNLKNDNPIIVENVDYGGHYKIIIGLDCVDKKDYLQDVLIFADPFDRNEGKDIDGYNYFSADRFFSMWFDDHCLEKNAKSNHLLL